MFNNNIQWKNEIVITKQPKMKYQKKKTLIL